MFEHRAKGWRAPWVLALLALGSFGGFGWGQEPKPTPPARGAITISFLPPPLEGATYSVGIFDARGRLVRRVKEFAPESAFTVGLNGLITTWDGKDNGLQPVAPGKYTARGYAVGALKVEGVGIIGNDWASEDPALRVVRVDALALVPDDEGIAVAAYLGRSRWELLRYAGGNGALLWHVPVELPMAKFLGDGLPHNLGLEVEGETLAVTAFSQRLRYQISDGHRLDQKSEGVDPGPTKTSPGKDGTVWKIEEGGLIQYSPRGEKLRSLVPKTGEPVPQAVAASTRSDRLYLLESLNDWQRVRGLSWVETRQEEGAPVSTWKTVFERNLNKTTPIISDGEMFTEVPLVENPLVPGKPQKARLRADLDDKGSYLATAEGLRLRRISESPDLSAVMLGKTRTPGRLKFLETDGAAWDEFAITGARNMMEFDAGEIEMTPEGEKTHPAKPTEPPDL